MEQQRRDSSVSIETGQRSVNKGAIAAISVLVGIVVAVIIAVVAVQQHQAYENCFWSKQYAGYSPADAKALC